VPPPRGYFRAIQPVLRRHDILLIADEVITGFGRTGAMFGCETYGIEPDLTTLAKGLTSAYAPLSACVVGERVWDVFMEPPTGSGRSRTAIPIPATRWERAAANAVLDIVEAEELPGNARRVGETFSRLLKRAFEDDPIVGNVRGVGLMAAIEFARRREPREFYDPSLKVGAKVAASLPARGADRPRHAAWRHSRLLAASGAARGGGGRDRGPDQAGSKRGGGGVQERTGWCDGEGEARGQTRRSAAREQADDVARLPEHTAETFGFAVAGKIVARRARRQHRSR
jgi:hypothetical protein